MAESNIPAVDEVQRQLPQRLLTQLGDVLRLTSGLEEGDLARRVNPAQWSLKELVAHLWRVEQVFEGRIEAMLQHEHPVLAPYEPDGDAEFTRLAALPSAELLKGFASAREGLVESLETLSAGQWRREGYHPEYRRYSVQFAVEYLAHHEAHHLYQMFQRRALL